MPRVTIGINTWRLGGFDCFMPALARQTYKDFEVVVADELHRWRGPSLRRYLSKLPFSVKHLPVTDSLFPVCSTMRAGNTVLRAASGEIVLQLTDYSVPPPDFVEAHVSAYDRSGGKIIGISPCLSRPLKPEYAPLRWKATPVWDIIDACAGHDCAEDFVSVFSALSSETWRDRGVDPNVVCTPEANNTIVFLEGAEIDEEFDEWACHFKSNSFALAAALEVDGWDEKYDGAYMYGDIDFALRLMATGAVPKYVGAPVEVVDAHPLFERLPSGAFLALQAERFLTDARERLTRGQYRAELGLSVPLSARQPAAGDGTKSMVFRFRGRIPWKDRAKAIPTTILRPWLEGGRADLLAVPEAAFAWRHLEPDVLVVTERASDVGGYQRVLGERCRVVDPAGLQQMKDGAFKTVILHGPGVDFLNGNLAAAERSSPSRIIATGSSDEMDQLETFVGDRLAGRRFRPGPESTIDAVILYLDL